MYLVLNVGCH